MQLSHRPKSPNDENQRSVSAEETLKKVEPLARAAGITRIADITDWTALAYRYFLA